MNWSEEASEARVRAAHQAKIDALATDRDQISLTLAVAKADRDKWFNRARELEKALRFCQFYMTDVKFPTDHPMALTISKALTTPETGAYEESQASRTEVELGSPDDRGSK